MNTSLLYCHPASAAAGKGPKPLLPLLLSLLLLAFAATGGRAEEPVRAKTALVLATFGSTVEQKADPLRLVRQELGARCPGMPVFVAYTSVHVASALRAKGMDAKSLNQVLADLAAAGYKEAVVQSLHVTPGKEFELVRTTANIYPLLPKGGLRTEVGLPLIGGHGDAAALAEVLAASLPKERKQADAVIFVGHGAESPVGSLAYPALQAFLWQKDPALFVGTVEGPYDAETLLPRVRQVLAENRGKTVWLVPLLTIVGDHAQNDIFGNERDSWKSTFRAAGFTVQTVERGLLDLPGVASLFAGHALSALEKLSPDKAARQDRSPDMPQAVSLSIRER